MDRTSTRCLLTMTAFAFTLVMVGCAMGGENVIAAIYATGGFIITAMTCGTYAIVSTIRENSRG